MKFRNPPTTAARAKTSTASLALHISSNPNLIHLFVRRKFIHLPLHKVFFVYESQRIRPCGNDLKIENVSDCEHVPYEIRKTNRSKCRQDNLTIGWNLNGVLGVGYPIWWRVLPMAAPCLREETGNKILDEYCVLSWRFFVNRNECFIEFFKFGKT